MDTPAPSPPMDLSSFSFLSQYHLNKYRRYEGDECRKRALDDSGAKAHGAFIVASGYAKYYVMDVAPSGVPQDVHGFELVRADRPIKPFADVEWYPQDLLPFTLDPANVVRVISSIADAMFGASLPPQVMRSSGTKEGELFESFHFVWPQRRVSKENLKAFGVELDERFIDAVDIVCDVIDHSVYNLPHLMRMLGQTKTDEPGRTFVAYEGSSSNVRDHLIGAYDGSDAPFWTPTTPVQAATLGLAVSSTAIDAGPRGYKDSPTYRDLVSRCVGLLSQGRADEYDSWKDVGMALCNMGEGIDVRDAFLPLWEAFSQRSRKYKAGECASKWRSFGGRFGGLTLGSLRHWAKEDDAEGYADVRRRFGRLYYAEKESALAASLLSLSLEPEEPSTPTQAASGASTPTVLEASVTSEVSEVSEAVAQLVGEVFGGEGMEYAEVDALVKELTNQSVADVIFNSHRGQLVHVGKDNWFEWTGQSWKAAKDVNVHAYFVKLAVKVKRRRAWWASPSGLVGHAAEGMIKGLTKAVTSLNATTFSNGTITKLKSLTNDPKFIEKLDVNPLLLGFDDGVYDLETGTFRRMLPADMVSKSVGYSFPTAETLATYRPLVEQMLKDIFEDEMREYFMRLYAENLDGRMRMELITILTGSGGNGKGIMAALLKKALGTSTSDSAGGYYYEAPVGLWTERANNAEAANPVMMMLRGVRVAMSTEPEGATETKLQVGRLKSYSGNDPITARMLYGDPIQFKPTGALSFQCNDIPKLSRVDGGIQRRLRIVPFVYKFMKSQAEIDNDNSGSVCKMGDPDLKGRILSDPGFGQAFIVMLLEVYAANKDAKDIPEPVEAAAATSRYIMENSKVGMWLNECYTRTGSDADRVSASDLHAAYGDETGDGRMNKNDFAKEMVNANVKKIKSHGIINYTGIKRTEEEAES